jgi:hypothetical protein
MPSSLRGQSEEEAPRVIERQSSRVQLMADSCHVRRSNSSKALGTTVGERRPRASERSVSMSVSYHGNRKDSSTSRKGLSRQKSSDEAVHIEPPKRQDSDDLGAATLHGKSTISRIRGSSKTTVPSARGGRRSDKRAAMNRAMSSENVKAPEEYGEQQPEVRRGRRRVTKEAEETSDDDDSFAGEEDEFGDIAPLKALSRRNRPKERRDLLLLLREKKVVQLSDFSDSKDNRRVLHFLLYQHKLGVDLEELQMKVEKDMARYDGGLVPRPIPPLYVEVE